MKENICGRYMHNYSVAGGSWSIETRKKEFLYCIRGLINKKELENSKYCEKRSARDQDESSVIRGIGVGGNG